MSVNVGSAIAYLELDTSKFQSGLKSASADLKTVSSSAASTTDKFKALGGGIASIGASISMVSVPLLGLGAGAIKTAGDFEAGMSKVQAISGATGEDMKKLEDMAKKMGATTKFSATDSADALSYMGMAGWKTQDMLDGLPGILNLAAAGGTDLALTSDIVTDGLTGLGLTAKDTEMFVDVMAATCSNSNTSIELMGESLKYVGPVAGTLGINMQDLSVAIGLAGNAGIKGSAAGTALRAGLTNLIKPTDKMAAAMKKYGIELVKNEDGSGNLMKTMENLRAKIGNLDQATQANVLATIFGKEAMSAWASIVNASEEDFNKLTGAINNSDGAAGNMAKTMQDNLKGSIDNMKSAFEGVLITIGERLIPMFQGLIQKITDVLTWFNNLSPGVQNVIIAIGGFIAVLGPLLLLIGGLIIFCANVATAVGVLSGAFATGGAVATFFAGAIALITGPVGLVIGAIVALVAAGYLLITNWEEISAFASQIWQGIVNTIDNVIGWICEKLGVDWELVKTNITQIWNDIKTNISECLGGIWNVITDTWNSIFGTISEALGKIKAVIDEGWKFIKTNIFEAIGNAIDALLAGDWEGFKNIISTAMENIRNKIKEMWEKIKNIISETMSTIKTKIDEAWEKIKTLVKTCVDNIKDSIKNGWNNMKDTIKTGMDNIKTIASTVWEGIKGDIEAKVKGIWDNIKNAFDGMVNSVKDSLNKAKQIAKDMWEDIKSIFKNPIKAVINIFKEEKSIKGPPNEEEIQKLSNSSDNLKNVKFNYSKVLDTIGSSNLTVDEIIKNTINDINIKVKKENVNTKSENKIKDNKLEIKVPVILDGREIAKVIAPYSDIENGSRLNLSERGVIL